MSAPEQDMTLAQAKAENKRLKETLSSICGELDPGEVAEWLEQYSTCELCSLDLIGFADRPASVLCEDCYAAEAAKGAKP